MEQCWRWFGPDDAVRLHEIRQAGATGIVTALHQIPYGVVWSIEEIEERKALIGADPALGLRWSVVESLPIHERVKLGEGDLTPIFDNYRASMRNLAACGVTTICYNFMPVLDWTRTDLAFPLTGGGTALKFDAVKFAAFDCFMLARAGAEAEHGPELVAKAQAWFRGASESEKAQLLTNINAGLPGAYDRYDIDGFRTMLAKYADVGREGLKANYARFLKEIIPTAEEVGIRMCVHPDDPPRPLFGLARIVSTGDDLDFIVNAVPSPANGITFCTGSLGAGAQNDVPALADSRPMCISPISEMSGNGRMAPSWKPSINGDTDMVAVMRTLMHEEKRRQAEDPGFILPFRPDHGHELLDDGGRKTHPGYPLIGRLRGLAELRGVMQAIARLDGLAA